MNTLYLRNVPDDVVRRLEKLAALQGTSVNSLAVRELSNAARRADNPQLPAALPDLQLDIAGMVDDLADQRGMR